MDDYISKPGGPAAAVSVLRQYLDAADYSQIGRQAHSIKEAGYREWNAESLRQVAAQMEPAAEEHKLEEVPGLFQNLQGAFESFREAVSGTLRPMSRFHLAGKRYLRIPGFAGRRSDAGGRNRSDGGKTQKRRSMNTCRSARFSRVLNLRASG